MQYGRILKTALAVGIAVNVFDFLVNGMLLMSWMENLPIMRQDASIPLLIVGDFIASLVLVLVYAKVRGSFGEGPKAGASFGFYIGVVANFPTWIFAYLLFNGMTYQAAWVMTIVGIVWTMVAGAVAGWVYGSDTPTAA